MRSENYKQKRIKAVGIIRVSTQEQADEGVSLDNQENKIRAYAEIKDLDLIEIIREEGKSGKDLKRDGIQRLIKMAEKKEIEAVVVCKLDRLTRKTSDLLFLVEKVFAKNGITFHSLGETIDTTTATGKFFLTIMGGLAQMERDLISERTADALQHLKRKQRRLGCPDKTPFGFKQSKRKMATLSDLKPDKKELPILKEMFSLRRKRKSYGHISEVSGMAVSSIYYILNNPIYEQLAVEIPR
jgi:site-specific DNA recombinase